MNNANQELVEKLKAEAERLSAASRLLLEAVAVLTGSSEGQRKEFSTVANLKVEQQGNRPTRESQVRDLLRKQGPLRTIDVIKLGIPRGTASSILSEKNGFIRTEDGRWRNSDL